MDIVAAFGGMQSKDPADSEVQAQVKKLQEFITEHYYNCSKVILNQLGQMYGAGGAFTENINAAGGAGADHLRRLTDYLHSGDDSTEPEGGTWVMDTTLVIAVLVACTMLLCRGEKKRS